MFINCQRQAEWPHNSHLRISTRGTGEQAFRLKPLGWYQALWKVAPFFAVGAFCFLIGLALWFSRPQEATLLNGLVAGGIFLMQCTMAAYATRDLFLPAEAFNTLAILNFMGSSLICVLAIHVALAFPSCMPILSRYPWLRIIPWIMLLLQTILHFGRFAPGPFWSIYVPDIVNLFLFGWAGLTRLLYKPDHVERKQMQWAILGAWLGLFPWLLLTGIPLLLGIPAVSQSATMLMIVFIPIGQALAVLRYRLLDIDALLNWFAIQSSVLILFFAFESLLFKSVIEFSFVSPDNYYGFLGLSLAFIILVYSPVRGFLARLLTKCQSNSPPSFDECTQYLLTQHQAGLDPWQALYATLYWSISPLEIAFLPQWPLNTDIPVEACLGFEIGLAKPQEAWGVVPLPRTECGVALLLSPPHSKGWSRRDLKLVLHLVEITEPLCALAQLDKQRKAMIQELHDGIGNQLFAISLLSSPIDGKSESAETQALQAIHTTTEEAVNTLYATIPFLSSPEGSFAPALVSLCLRTERTAQATGMEFTYHIDDDCSSLKLPHQNTLSLLRCLQELLGNAFKHSRGTTLQLSATVDGKNLRLYVKDNGVGWSSQDPQGLGLVHIRERLAALSSHLSIESSPDNGVAATIINPIPMEVYHASHQEPATCR